MLLRPILTVGLVIEDQLHSCGHVSKDVQGEDDDDEEGTEMTEAVHDSVEEEDEDEPKHMKDTDAEDADHQPLLTEEDVPEYPGEGD